MIAAADIEDQEVAIRPECPSVYHPSIGRGSHLCASSGGNGKAFFGPTVAIRGTKFLQPYAVNRTWNPPAQRSESNGRRQAPGVAKRRQRGPVVGPRGLARIACCLVKPLFELGDQILQIVHFAGEATSTGPLSVQCLFALSQL